MTSLGSLALTSTKVQHSRRVLSDAVRLWHVNAELVRQKLDDVRRQQYHLRLPSHTQQFFTMRFTPTAERSYTNSGTIGQFLFRHCFHILHHTSDLLHLTSNILHLTSNILHHTSYIFLRQIRQKVLLYARRNVDFSFLTVHVYTRVRKHLAHLSDLAFLTEQMSRWTYDV